MNRYRIRYKKTGPMRYISHLDLLRTVERSARRARLPLAFTEGFNPHPRISFAAPLPVGVEGCDEYLDLELETSMQPSMLAEKLNAGLPAGLSVLDVKEVDIKGPSLMGLVEQATYLAEARLPPLPDEKDLAVKIKKFLEQGEIKIEKRTKKGTKLKDIRSGIIELKGEIHGSNLLLKMTLKTGSRENIRPEEVLRALVKGYLPLNVEDFRITRTGLFTAGNRPLNAEVGS